MPDDASFDGLEELRRDHLSVESLFAKVSGTAEADPAVVNRIVKDLSVHDVIEKEHLYPLVRDRLPEGNQLATRSFDEHASVAADLAEIDRRPPDDPYRRELLDRLMLIVRTHVDEEEGQIFPALRARLAPEELDELGTALRSARSKAPTRPHPHSPRGGLATKVVGAAAAPLDKLRDRVHRRP
ncbi:MAG TPA: hemerythrin domain-containing protein [Acidimicrobiales bacterium]|jgi:hemerythrin superfamily protein|nr:hemerythrin domain-containing protein [Acidimicrobiales bacterium]